MVPTDRAPPIQPRGTVSSAANPAWHLPFWSLALCLGVSAAPLPPDPGTAVILVSAVEAASALDLYNARCRSDGSGRHMDNLNKELVGKLRLTVISVQDDFFPEHSYRRAQQRLQQQFVATLREAGGCKGAKDSGLPDRLRTSYQESLDAIEALP